MKHPLLKATLVSATMLAAIAAFASSALPQTSGRPAQHMQGEAAGGGEPPVAAQERVPPGPRVPHHGPGALELAATLSAAELYVGITPEQLGAWRAYTSALIALFDFGPEGPGPRSQAQQPDGLFGEDIADRMVTVSENAKTLKEAVVTLRGVLTPDQTEKLAVLRQTLQPHPDSRDEGLGPGMPQEDTRPEYGLGPQN